jgi:transposase
MNHSISVVGLDVHKDSITVAFLPPRADQPTATMTVETERRVIEKLAKKLGSSETLDFVYEAGPCGYEVHRWLTALGYRCTVVAPGLIPVRPTDRVKTDRRDAGNLARLHRAGLLTPIAVPTEESEAARDLVRGREDALTDRLRARNRLGKFLLRHGRVYRETKAWGIRHRVWLRGQKYELGAAQQTFDSYLTAMEDVEQRIISLDNSLAFLATQAPFADTVRYLRCLKGVDTLSALTMAVEAREFRRFPSAPAFMAYTGLVPSESSSGGTVQRGGITKSGNAHLRRVLVEAAWCNHQGSGTSVALQARRKGCPEEVIRIACRAQDRLRRKFWKMTSRGKPHTITVAAVARELAGFVWSIGQLVPGKA